MKLLIPNSTLKAIYKDIIQGDDEVSRVAYNLLFGQDDEGCHPYQRIEVLELIETELLTNIHTEYVEESRKRWGEPCLR
jgi:hypothetical protein